MKVNYKQGYCLGEDDYDLGGFELIDTLIDHGIDINNPNYGLERERC